MATTTANYKVYPSGASGITRQFITTWTNSDYTELVPINTITSAFRICAICFMFPQTPTDQTAEAEMDIAVGVSGSEVVVATIPIVHYRDSSAGHQIGHYITFDDPIEVGANARVAVRGRTGATSSPFPDQIKIMYL
jgi:Tfp pilus assembly ATPase PilU